MLAPTGAQETSGKCVWLDQGVKSTGLSKSRHRAWTHARDRRGRDTRDRDARVWREVAVPPAGLQVRPGAPAPCVKFMMSAARGPRAILADARKQQHGRGGRGAPPCQAGRYSAGGCNRGSFWPAGWVSGRPAPACSEACPMPSSVPGLVPLAWEVSVHPTGPKLCWLQPLPR